MLTSRLCTIARALLWRGNWARLCAAVQFLAGAVFVSETCASTKTYEKNVCYNITYFLLCTSTRTSTPPRHRICIHMVKDQQFDPVCIDSELVSQSLPVRGWNLTCDRVSHQWAKTSGSSSSSPAENLVRSGTRSTNWSWLPWCR